jgi:hypothetical protein
MHYLIYISYANTVLSDEDLKQILLKSEEKNNRAGITGMLVYMEGKFIQLLEGAKEDIFNLLEVIKQDDRHKKLTVLLEGELESRNFPGWSMGFKTLNPEEFEAMSGFTKPDMFFNISHIHNESHPAMIFLKLFYQKNKRDFITTN